MFKKVRGSSLAYILILPAFALILIFTLYPFGRALWTSFHRINPVLPGNPFVGFSNYTSVFSSYYFVKSLRNTLIMIGFTVPIITIMSIAISRLLIENFYGRGILRPAVLIPWVIPSAITGLIWQWLFNGSYGAINALLSRMGVISDYIPWLTEVLTAKFAVMVAFIWAQLPFPIILMLAAMTAIPSDLYDAAKVDGATAFDSFRYITWPHIRTMAVIVIIYETLTAFTSYSIPYAMTGGGPGTATSMISYYIWSLSFDQLQFGKGAALAAIIAGLSLIFIFAIIKAIPSEIMLEEE
ncbi:MAG: sugar ABC transporter permease [Candidatus Bipolaricaulota bacterium]|nr:sugar ABC transporter permease [Candidatus Bipolaricaulota bacterium]MBS3792831.1 sugar ABC transporter permease [Candidatus Bipolaricaulota bacterium]